MVIARCEGTCSCEARVSGGDAPIRANWDTHVRVAMRTKKLVIPGENTLTTTCYSHRISSEPSHLLLDEQAVIAIQGQ